MLKALTYLMWGFLVVLFLIVLVPMAYAEGCDSATNSNCIETNSNTTWTNAVKAAQKAANEAA